MTSLLEVDQFRQPEEAIGNLNQQALVPSAALEKEKANN